MSEACSSGSSAAGPGRRTSSPTATATTAQHSGQAHLGSGGRAPSPGAASSWPGREVATLSAAHLPHRRQAGQQYVVSNGHGGETSGGSDPFRGGPMRVKGGVLVGRGGGG